MLSRFHLILERNGQTNGQTDGWTDGRTDRFAISISRVSMLTSDKNLRSFITVTAHCSVTQIKNRKKII